MLEYTVVSDRDFSVPWTLDRSGRSNPSRETPERVEAVLAGLRRGGARRVTDGPVDGETLHSLLSAVHGEEFLAHLRAEGADGAFGDDADQLPGQVKGFAAPGLAQDTPVLTGA